MPMEEKTGTTIVGIKYATGIILCADTRSTSGPVVANKNCEKIHFIFDKIMCCGAGTAADTRRVTRMASSELQLFSYKHNKQPYITHAERLITDYLHSYGGQIGAALVLGGVDANGIKLYSISPNGYSASLDYTSLGSGSYAAIAILEKDYSKNMSKDEAMALGVRAVKAGILNDLYSGSNVDVCVIDTVSGVEKHRNYLKVEERKNDSIIKYPSGSVAVLAEEIHNYVDVIEE
ncbi:20S proteasome subunit beta 2 [Pancytospora epiphaga]|nr:20S proteasome subunit beta 2 [Pancytospora epiphaga]